MYRSFQKGFIEMIVGCMFAGKTEELIRRVSVLRRAKKNVLVFKPKFDNRQTEAVIYTHEQKTLSAFLAKTTEVVGLKLRGWAVGRGERPIKLRDSWFSPKCI